MKQLFTIAAVAAFITGCCNGDGPAKSKHSGKSYYPIKVCSIGDMTGESCVEYAVKKYWKKGRFITIETLDGHMYAFNYCGWSIIITEK